MGVVAVALSALAAGVGLAAGTVMIPPGSEIELMVLAEIETRTAGPGTTVRLRVNRPLKVGDNVIIPVGALAYGRVDHVERSGIAGARGSLGVRLSHVVVDGADVLLANDLMVFRARGGKGDDAARFILAPFYAPFAPANAAKLKAGDLITARIAGPGAQSPLQ